MKANELRIENYVINGFNETLKIQNIISKLNTDGYLLETLKPIPLTEEWLLKFGFKKQKTIISGNVYSIKINKTNNWFSVHEQSEYDDPNSLSLKELKKWWSFNDNRYEVKIKSIHQLQNLYFALTNEELTIKL